MRTVRGTLVPSSSSNRMAMPMKMLDKDFEAKSLEVPLATIDDLREVVSSAKPSVNKSDSIAIEQFQKEFGEKLEAIINEESVPMEQVMSAVQSLWGVYASTTALYQAMSSASSALWSMLGTSKQAMRV
jgi:hypothetical protein